MNRNFTVSLCVAVLWFLSSFAYAQKLPEYYYFVPSHGRPLPCSLNPNRARCQQNIQPALVLAQPTPSLQEIEPPPIVKVVKGELASTWTGNYYIGRASVLRNGQTSEVSLPGWALAYGVYARHTWLGLNWGIRGFYSTDFKNASEKLGSKQKKLHVNDFAVYGGGLTARWFLNSRINLMLGGGYLKVNVHLYSPEDKTSKALSVDGNAWYFSSEVYLRLFDFGPLNFGLGASYRYVKRLQALTAGVNISF